ncbi:QueT transporter family protein [Culicoidibacter larvae]|nr:QueT transporter family protein [Culicoidibacter larvae]
MNNRTKSMATNAILAAVYVAVSLFLAPFSFGAIQLRVAEMLNATYMCKPKWLIGVAIGVFITNLFSPFGMIDVFFGTANTIISGVVAIMLARKVKSLKWRLVINSIVCAVGIVVIAIELAITGLPFWESYATLFVGELLSMTIGSFIFYLVISKSSFMQRALEIDPANL